jgi:hypothetical protein
MKESPGLAEGTYLGAATVATNVAPRKIPTVMPQQTDKVPNRGGRPALLHSVAEVRSSRVLEQVPNRGGKPELLHSVAEV